MTKINSKLGSVLSFLNNHPLSRRHKLRAYYNFFSWQISQLLNPGDKIISFIGKTKLLVRKGQTGATGNIYTGLHEFHEMSFLLHFLQKEDLFADIGANIGSYSILASGYRNAKTIAVEPIPSTFSSLNKNVELNKLNDLVTCMNIGLGSVTEEKYFTSSYDTVNHVVPIAEISIENNKIAVKMCRFDDIVKDTGVPLLMKIDVEGFETEVMKGMSQTLLSPNLKAIIIELNGSGTRYGFDEKLIHQKLVEHGFKPYHYEPFKRALQMLQTNGTNNTIYIRDYDFVFNRLKTAANIEVFSESF